MTDKYQITSTSIIDMLPVAQAAEDGLQDMGLLPKYPKGLYVHGRSLPSLVPGVEYYQLYPQPDGEVIKVPLTLDNVQKLMLLDRHIYDAVGNIAVSSFSLSNLQPRPSLPLTGLKVVRALIDDLLQRSFDWTQKPSKGENEIVHEALGHSDKLDNVHVDIVTERILFHMRPIEHQLCRFIGTDTWHIYLTKTLSETSIAVSKTIDYRIATYNEKVASGEWKP